MKNLTWQNPEQLFVAQELINKVKSKCCGIKDDYYEDGSTDILLSAGVLFNTVIDGNGTNKYRLNSLGVMLLKYGLQQDIDFEINTSTHLSDLDWHEA